MQKRWDRKDLFVLLAAPPAAAILCGVLNANYLVSIMVFFVLPALYLTYKRPDRWKKVAIFSAAFSIPFTVIIDYIAIVSGSWIIDRTVLPFNILGVIPIEDFFWGFFFVYYIIMFYEVFFDRGKTELLDKHMKWLFMLAIVSVACFVAVFLIDASLLVLPYAYMWIGIILTVLPLAGLLLVHPELFTKVAITGIFFFYATAIYEATALALHIWSFPGTEFIGLLTVLGYSVPFEEVLFWMMLCAPAGVCLYEIFDDDMQ